MSVYKKHFAELEKCFVAAENSSMSRAECFSRFLNMLAMSLEQANNRFFGSLDEELETAYMREKKCVEKSRRIFASVGNTDNRAFGI